jgi:hypothetical protein
VKRHEVSPGVLHSNVTPQVIAEKLFKQHRLLFNGTIFLKTYVDGTHTRTHNQPQRQRQGISYSLIFIFLELSWIHPRSNYQHLSQLLGVMKY